MELQDTDFQIRRFFPDDGSTSAAIKLLHRTDQAEVMCDQTPCPVENLRRAVAKMTSDLNPNPATIREPSLLLFDEVTVKLPESTQFGRITRAAWDFKCAQWNYFVQCQNDHSSAWYELADLQLFKEA